MYKILTKKFRQRYLKNIYLNYFLSNFGKRSNFVNQYTSQKPETMLKKTLTLAFIFLISFTLYAQDKKLNIAIVAFYNVENLYDTIDDPIKNDNEFLPTGSQKWDIDKFNLKLERISEVISKIGQDVVPDGPAVIGLSEVENRFVVEQLIATDNLKSKNYGIVHYNSPDRRGVDVALLYQKNRFELEGSKPFTLKSSDTISHPRPAIGLGQARWRTDVFSGEPLAITQRWGTTQCTQT